MCFFVIKYLILYKQRFLKDESLYKHSNEICPEELDNEIVQLKRDIWNV